MQFLKKLLRRGLPLWIVLAGCGVVYWMAVNKPVVEQRNPEVALVEVDAVRLKPQPYTIVLETQGTVSARTRSTLIPEVSGRVISVSPNFREGGFFKTGDVLLEIDPIDYQTAVVLAEANLAEAQLRLAEEEAQSGQAMLDWQRLGAGDTPSELVLRKPQLAFARANVAAAEARLQEAKRNLERTRIAAPYDGRVLSQRVDVGQVVNSGTVLAEVYAVDYAEIRLPLTSREYAFLDLNSSARGGSEQEAHVPVTLLARFGDETVEWEGRIVRVEGAIDSRSRQIFVVAQVDDPYGPDHPQPLKVGLFVEAKIQGSVIDEAYVLPRTALREARFVLTLTEDDRLRRVPITPIWANATEVVFREPTIAPGTLASVTPLALATEGMKVRPILPDAATAREGILAKCHSGELDDD